MGARCCRHSTQANNDDALSVPRQQRQVSGATDSVTRVGSGECRMVGTIGRGGAKKDPLVLQGAIKRGADGFYLSLVSVERALSLRVELGATDKMEGSAKLRIVARDPLLDSQTHSGEADVSVAVLDTLRVVEDITVELKPVEQSAQLLAPIQLQGSLSWRVVA